MPRAWGVSGLCPEGLGVTVTTSFQGTGCGRRKTAPPAARWSACSCCSSRNGSAGRRGATPGAPTTGRPAARPAAAATAAAEGEVAGPARPPAWASTSRTPFGSRKSTLTLSQSSWWPRTRVPRPTTLGRESPLRGGQAVRAAGGPFPPHQLPSGFLFCFVFISFCCFVLFFLIAILTMVFRTLHGLGSSLLGSAHTSPPLPPSPAPVLGLSWVLPRPLPKPQICSSHSRWLRVGRDEGAAPTPSGLSQKRRCLMMHFTDGQGLGGKPRCSCTPASRAAGRPHSDLRLPAPPGQVSSTSVLFSLGLFFQEKKKKKKNKAFQ